MAALRLNEAQEIRLDFSPETRLGGSTNQTRQPSPVNRRIVWLRWTAGGRSAEALMLLDDFSATMSASTVVFWLAEPQRVGPANGER